MQVEVSCRAQGNGTDSSGGSSNQTRKLGLRGLADLFDAGYDNGISLWDSTDQGTGLMQCVAVSPLPEALFETKYGAHVTEALKRVPREKVAILSKTHASDPKKRWAPTWTASGANWAPTTSIPCCCIA